VTVSEQPERMPMPPEAELSEEARRAIEEVAAGPRGALLACFVPFLHVPELLGLLQNTGAYLRYRGVLRPDLRELLILCVAEHWRQDFEWGVHQPIALSEGLPEAVIADVGRGRRPASGSAEVVILWDLATELQDRRQVSDEVYDAAAALFNEAELAETLGLIGYYTTLALTMNAVRTAVPPGPRLPKD
jgi:4-carboxymuconolactone decarboxylase